MNNKKLYIRELKDSDIELFTSWLKKDYILKWYENPSDWLNEVENRDDEFKFIKHYIVMYDDIPIGFCQYYDCYYAKEEWYDVKNPNSLFSIDYLIGEEEYLNKGYGKAIISILTNNIKHNTSAKQIVVQPEKENIPSNKALLSVGYVYNQKRGYYVLDI